MDVSFTDRELDVMHVLWERGPATVAEVREHLPDDLAYTLGAVAGALKAKRLLLLTDVPGVLVGHAHDPEALTGCTVVLTPEGAVGGVDVRGGGPSTRETDLLGPLAGAAVHAVALCGGSAFGLAAATGVCEWLRERGAARRAGPPLLAEDGGEVAPEQPRDGDDGLPRRTGSGTRHGGSLASLRL